MSPALKQASQDLTDSALAGWALTGWALTPAWSAVAASAEMLAVLAWVAA